MNKRIAILSAVLLALALFFAAAQAANADEPQTVQTYVSRDEAKDLLRGNVSTARRASAKAKRSSPTLPSGLETAIANAIMNCEDSVDASSWQLAYSDSLKAEIAAFVFNSSPEFFNVKQIGYYRTGGDSPVLVSVTFVYSFDAARFGEMMDGIRAAAADLLDGIQGNAALGETEKALLIHDRLALRCEYDRLYLETDGASKSETAGNMYGALVARQAVCQGYAEAYQYLLNQVGVDCDVTTTDMMLVNGELAPHAWNIVYIGGTPYHADVTWDDPTNDVTGRVVHNNFLLSTAKFTSERDFISTDYDFDTSPVSTAYDGYFWRNVKSAFTLLGQSVYYLDAKNFSLNRYSDRAQLLAIDASWPVHGEPGYVYSDMMARLATDGDDLFYNTDTAVYRYSVADGTAAEVYAPAGSDRSIVGFAYEDGYFIGEFTSLVNYTLSTKAEDGFRYQYKEVPATEALSAARVTLSWSSKAYNGAVQKPTVTVKNAAGNTLTKGTDYTVAYSDASGKTPGDYTVTVTGTGGYSGTVQKSYTITKQPLSAARVTLGWSSRTYNGAVQKPSVTVKNAAGYAMTQNTSYTVSWSADSKAPGTYRVTVTGKGYYSGSAAKTYTITKQPLDASRMTLSASSFVYNGAAQKPTVTVKNAAGYAMTQGSSYTLSWSGDGKAPGKYTVTATGKGYYTGTAVKTYTVIPGRVTNLKAVKNGADKATLTWDAVPGAEKYMVYYATAKDGTYTAYASPSGTSYTMSKTGAGSLYYKVRAFATADGSKIYGSSSAVVRPAPGQVTNLKAVKVSADKATLTWSAASGAEKYMVYYASSENGTYTAYGITANLTYTIGRTGAGSCYYKVRAFVTADGGKLYGAYSAAARAK